MTLDPRDFRGDTAARADAVERIKRAVADELGPADLRALLSTLPAPDEGAVDRVKAGAIASAGRPSRGWGRAAALGGAGVAALIAWSAWPEPPAPVVVDWEEGMLSVESDGAERIVRTREAEIHSRGAEIDVVRDALGTAVIVRSGTPEIRCIAETRATTCLPVSADGMLGRARALDAAGAPADEVLGEVVAGIGRFEGTDAGRAELTALRVQLTSRLGRDADALAVARDHLAGGSALRRDEIETLAASLALRVEGCSGAVPHLDALAPTHLDAALQLAVCAPERARAVLDAALPLATTPEDQDALRRARHHLLGASR